jgi:AhpD family alkylhydroperoxidase
MLGITPNLARALANSPAALRGYLGFAGALCGGSLSRVVREQIALLVAQETGCDYSLSAHSYTATRVVGLKTPPEPARARPASHRPRQRWRSPPPCSAGGAA